MDDLQTFKEATPILTEIPRYQGHLEPLRTFSPTPSPQRLPWLNVALFLLTLLTTTMAGADTAGAEVTLGAPLQSLVNLSAGLSFSIPLMAILLAHEMGHYLMARRHAVDTSLPYFIPAPYPSLFFIGTFGAFIRMRSPAQTRRAMFDIGAAGPWAGFVVAVIAVIIGLRLSKVGPLDTSGGGLELGNSMLFWGISRVVLGVDPNSVNVNLHPIAFAGWLGLFVTTLNLLPVGQLDGGHVVYSLFGGRAHRWVSRLFALGCVLMIVVPYYLGLNFWAGWAMWLVIVILLGLGHPATTDAETPLTGRRRLTAWATVALFVVTFSPVPLSFTPPSDQQTPQQGQTYSVSQVLPDAGAMTSPRSPLWSGRRPITGIHI